MKTDLKTDNFGSVTNIRYHDGYLLGIVFTDAYYKSLHILAEPSDGAPYRLECQGIEGFLASEFRNGSGISDLYQWRSCDKEGEEIISKLRLADREGIILERAKDKLCLKIECIDDCEVFVVCCSVKYTLL